MPSATFRVATFNTENLFARYRFKSNVEPLEDTGFTINDTAFEIFDEVEKRLTAQAMREVSADVIALQEVENLLVLDRFVSRYLAGMGYTHRTLIDGNDPRQINVAVLSRFPIVAMRSHRHERDHDDTASLFSRDCLEVEVNIGGRPLTLYVNHFKSMLGGRAETRDRRREQAERVVEILESKWGGSSYKGNFIVLGDFNDYLDPGTALTDLVTHPELVNLLGRLPLKEQWTHYFAGGKKGEKTKQLDYLLLGKALDARAKKPKPAVMRKGLPFRALDYSGGRLEGVGHDDPKASDHCPLYVDVPKAALA